MDISILLTSVIQMTLYLIQCRNNAFVFGNYSVNVYAQSQMRFALFLLTIRRYLRDIVNFLVKIINFAKRML